jgi:hypothetical protein
MSFLTKRGLGDSGMNRQRIEFDSNSPRNGRLRTANQVRPRVSGPRVCFGPSDSARLAINYLLSSLT